MTAKVILNPYANRWNASKRCDDVKSLLLAAGIQHDLVLTDAPQRGIHLALQAAKDGFSPIIAAGGDGTISEIMNGMVLATQEMGLSQPPVLGVLPLGSANDLVVNLKLPTNLESAVTVIAAGNTRCIDLGEVQAHNLDGTQKISRYFDNNSAIGLEPTITLIQQRISFLHGTIRYLAATLVGVMRKPLWDAHMEWEGGEYHGPTSLVTIGNNPLTGGLFYMTPHADPFDGLLSFVYGAMPTRRQILRLLPRTMKPGPGSYVEHPDIHEAHTPWLRIQTEQPTPVHADGEILFPKTRQVSYRVLPKYLPVLLP
ncbi:MAG: diacylglycerol kinase family lipid kinase [Anaerolineales bacterium]|nr:diacylglycerol kinase family lipid kinase [Anaerolineales bacterium]